MKLSSPIYQLKRRAKSMAREARIPLHVAQDRIAQAEGFSTWSLLCSKTANSLAKDLLDRVEDGDLVLLAARPGHGKTIVGLRTLLDARKANKAAILFTLYLTEDEARRQLVEMGNDEIAKSVGVETSDEIDADYIIDALSDAAPGTVAVVDYLQMLDERRSKPALAEQIVKLRLFTENRKVVLIFLSQVDRTFDPTQHSVPDVTDVRLPNPLPIEVFKKRLFLHDGNVRMDRCAA